MALFQQPLVDFLEIRDGRLRSGGQPEQRFQAGIELVGGDLDAILVGFIAYDDIGRHDGDVVGLRQRDGQVGCAVCNYSYRHARLQMGARRSPPFAPR